MELLTILLLWAIAIGFYAYSKKKTPTERPPETIISDDEDVTVEDMVIHDIENQDDVWDIGRVDFNE